jgi:hypothetical protein
MIPIELEHPEYMTRKALWRKYRHLYVGGEEMKARGAEYLVPRQKEPAAVFQERVNRIFYENYIGSIVDWYAATLFRREPALGFEGYNEGAKRFFNEFTEDCDLRGSSLADFFRRQFVQAMIGGASYIVVDFPRVAGPARNRAEEEALGASRAYLAGYSPDQVINWACDDRGEYEWVVIRTSDLRKARWEDPKWQRVTRWVHYDRERFRVFQSVQESSGAESPQLVDEGYHGLAKLRKVPVFEMRVSDGLWLMNKAALLQLEHFNKSNALSWSLTMGLFSMPVVYTERDWNQVVGESYYIQLAPGDRFGWTEPEGKVYQIATDNLTRLKDEIYRVCYLLAQAGGPFSSGAAQSGLSKQRDYAVTQEVLRAYGDMVKDTMKRVLRAVNAAREDGLMVDVSGMDEFDVGDFSSEIDDAMKLLNAGDVSSTLRKQVLKKLAFKYLCDVRQEVKDTIAREIDGATS